MKTPSVIRLSEIKVRKHLPSHLTVGRIHANRKAYNRRNARKNVTSGW